MLNMQHHSNLILNGCLCVSLSDDRTGLFLYFNDMLVSLVPSPSRCHHDMNGQDDSWFTSNCCPKMKVSGYFGQDINSNMLVRATLVEVSAPYGHPRIQTLRGSTIQQFRHLEHTAPSSSEQEERVHGELTPVLVCLSLSHKFTRSCLLVTKYRIDSSHHTWNILIS